MESIAVIGLGRFGGRLARALAQAGREVIAIDLSRESIELIRDHVTQAIALDATDEAALRSRGVHKVDVAVVGIGNDFEATVLATVTLKQLGVPRVIARAANAVSAQVLRRVGADAVVMPEDESADRWASRLIGPAVLNQIEFHEGYSIIELRLPRSWVGRSLAELGVRARFGLHVVAIKREHRDADDLRSVRIEVPGPNDPLTEGDVVVLMGKDEDLAKLPRE
jgi:trk system potassium uptake protein TrkA